MVEENTTKRENTEQQTDATKQQANITQQKYASGKRWHRVFFWISISLAIAMAMRGSTIGCLIFMSLSGIMVHIVEGKKQKSSYTAEDKEDVKKLLRIVCASVASMVLFFCLTVAMIIKESKTGTLFFLCLTVISILACMVYAKKQCDADITENSNRKSSPKEKVKTATSIAIIMACTIGLGVWLL